MTFPQAMHRALLTIIVAGLSSQGVGAQSSRKVPPQETLVQKLLRIAGLTVAPSQMRGPGDEVEPGSIWIADLDRHTTRAITTDGGYRSPVFAPDGTIYALKGDSILRVFPEKPGTAKVRTVRGVTKLAGFDRNARDEVVVLLDAARSGSPLRVVSLKTGKVTPLPYDSTSDADRQLVAEVRGQDRVYGGTTVYTKTETKRGLSRTIQWTDVYIARDGAAPLNISVCGGVNCAQPALSPDGQAVAYVKVQR